MSLMAEGLASPANSPDEWRSLAVDNANAAKELLAKGHWQQAFQLAGFAVECALNAVSCGERA